MNSITNYLFNNCRVMLFQANIEEMEKKIEKYNDGEKLFGMALTEYPTLYRRRKEINFLSKLYDLYTTVSHAIESYYKIPWSQIDSELIISEMSNFQSRFCVKFIS